MIHASRRNFICQTSVAAAAALAVVPSLTRFSLGASPATPELTVPTLSEPLTAYVRDAAAGEIALFIGTREVIVRDAALVARLVQAVG